LIAGRYLDTGGVMQDQQWYRLYEAVLLRLDAPHLKERIDAIDVVIDERLAELQPGSENDNDKELRMLADAKEAIEILRRR
jgi:hypothetical protein